MQSKQSLKLLEQRGKSPSICHSISVAATLSYWHAICYFMWSANIWTSNQIYTRTKSCRSSYQHRSIWFKEKKKSLKILLFLVPGPGSHQDFGSLPFEPMKCNRNLQLFSLSQIFDYSNRAKLWNTKVLYWGILIYWTVFLLQSQYKCLIIPGFPCGLSTQSFHHHYPQRTI